MNPAKRKKLYRLELQKEQQATIKTVDIVVKEEKVLLKEEVVTQEPVAAVVQESTTEVSNLELGLKITEALETSEIKKDKKKKWSSQDV